MKGKLPEGDETFGDTIQGEIPPFMHGRESNKICKWENSGSEGSWVRG